MSVTLQDCFVNQYLPNHTDYLLKIEYPQATCPHCNAPLYLNINLEQLYCANSNCKGKLLSRLLNLGKHFGIEYWPEIVCLSLIEDYHIESPLHLINLEVSEQMEEQMAFSILTIQSRLQQDIQSICDIVALSFLPSLSNLSHTLFYGYPNFSSFYNDIEFGEVSYIANKLGLCEDLCIYAAPIYEQLLLYKEEFLNLEQYYIDNYVQIPCMFVTFGELTNTINHLDTLQQLALKYPSIHIVHQGIMTPQTQYFVSNLEPSIEQNEFCQSHDIEALFLYELEEKLDAY